MPDPGSAVTMSDVAKVAGVSATTVSHVLNKSRRIDPETERAVQAAIESTGYVNDRVARSLRTGKTKTVGLAISAISNPYFGDVVHAIEKRVTANGHSLLLADTHDDAAYELRAVTHLLAHRPDGILIAPSSDPHESLSRIARRRIPTVLIDRVSPDIGTWSFDAVGVENAGPTAELVEHLAGLGHRRIGMVPGRPGLQTTIERIEGFRDGHRRRGLPLEERYIAHGAAGAADAIDVLLGLSDPPTAIVMGNNQATIEAVRRLTERGVAIPRDVSIASFDDFPWADLFHPRLTAIRQPVDELGERAVAMLFERMDDPEQPARTVRLTPTLIRRDSAAAPPERTHDEA
jgi:LacI family transcriptional regulator